MLRKQRSFMSVEFIIRLIGAIIFCVLGVFWGTSLGCAANLAPGPHTFSDEQYAFTMGLVGVLFGLIITPYLTTRPVRALRIIMARISAQALFASLIGIIIG